MDVAMVNLLRPPYRALTQELNGLCEKTDTYNAIRRAPLKRVRQ
jgi:hypothetical protein